MENEMATRHLSQIELAARWNISHRTLERWRWTVKARNSSSSAAASSTGSRTSAYEAEQIRQSTSGHRHQATA